MDEQKKSFYKILSFWNLNFVFTLFLILLFYSCDTSNDLPILEIPQNTDSLAIEFYKSESYLKFINVYMIQRERNSDVYLYYSGKLDISFTFKKNGNDIKVKDEVAVRLDSIHHNSSRNEIGEIKAICNAMDRYSINSFWGVFPDTSAEKLEITFENFEQVYFRINDSSYKKNLNLRIGDTIFCNRDWVLLK